MRPENRQCSRQQGGLAWGPTRPVWHHDGGRKFDGGMVRPTGLSAQIDDPRYNPRMRRGFDGFSWDVKKWSLALPAKSGLKSWMQ